MKSFNFFCCFVLLFFLGFSVSAQDNTEEKLNLPGDNLNLYAVMKLFQESETLEGFEKNLNAEDSKINNLDLNGDDKIDYIKVIDNVNGNDHTIVLQVAVNERENQDVAVFTVQKDKDNNVQIQLVGDEELYGKDYIIEPNYADNASAGETPNPGYTGNTRTVNGENVVVTKTTYVEVATWPLISYLFMPSYIAWHSPWYWGYYPSYWNPWRPYYWDYYYGYHSHWNYYYYGHFRPWHYYRYAHWNDHYYNTHRSYSNTVYQRRQNGSYKSTYSRPDMRQQGSADFVKRHPESLDRSNGRNTLNQGTNRQGTKSGINQPVERRGGDNPAMRQGTTSPTNRQGIGNQENRRNENRSSSPSGINNRSERKSNDRPAVKSENKRSEPRRENTKRSSEPRREKTSRSSEPRKSDRSTDRNSERRK